jgi:hypothetical protein
LAFSGRFALCPWDGGRLELPGVFGGSLSFASSSATRAHNARIRASFSASVSLLRSAGAVMSA